MAGQLGQGPEWLAPAVWSGGQAIILRQEWRLARAGPWAGYTHEVIELGGWFDRVHLSCFEMRGWKMEEGVGETQ